MNHNIAIAEQLALIGGIDPATGGVAVVTSAAFDTKLHRRIFVVVNGGLVTSTGVLTITFTSSATLGGSYTAVTGLAAVPTIIASGAKVLYEFRVEALAGVPGNFEFVKVVATTTLAAVAYGVEVWGASERYLPASDYNVVAVTNVVLN
jgi:predicted aconitase with swiveling domain